MADALDLLGVGALRGDREAYPDHDQQRQRVVSHGMRITRLPEAGRYPGTRRICAAKDTMDPRLLNKTLFHLERLLSGGAEHDWQQVEALLERLVAGPADAQTAGLARRLPGALEQIRQRLLPGDAMALAAELRRGARRAGTTPAATEEDDQQRVRRLLAGRSVLLIGGDVREAHRQRLGTVLGAEVHWPRTSENKPDLPALEPWIARPDVVAVLLLIRWIRHALGDVATLCQRYDKPLVRLPAGYNPSQVCAAILDQGERRLGGG
jgi:hypothetical protein